MRQKFLPFLLAIITAYLPASAYDFMVDGLCYNINEDGTSVTVTYQIQPSPYSSSACYSNLSGSIAIPSSVTHEGSIYSVTSINELAFLRCGEIESISIPSTISSIGQGAFSGCENLSRVDITDLTAWCNISFAAGGGAAVNPLFYAHKLYLNGMLVKDLEIPETITSIRDYAFYGCNSLTSVSMPESVTLIGRAAFAECTGLNGVNFSNSVTTIGMESFYSCRSLENIIIPNSVTEIGSYAFTDCTGLTSVTIGNSVITIGGNAFGGCTGLTSMTLPSSITTIGGGAFNNCRNMATITIPPSVTSIGSNAFEWCSSLIRVNITDLAAWCRISFNDGASNPLVWAHKLYLNNKLVKDLIIPEDVISINNYAFSSCTALQSAVIGNDVKNVGSYAFSGCTGLTNVTIGNSVTGIGSYAFNNCSNLTDLTVGEAVNSVDRYTFYSCNSLETVNWNAKNCKDLPSAFFPNSSGITTFNFGDQVLRIPGYLCYGLGNLTDVEIPATVTTIGDNAFRNCTSLESLTLPDAVTSVNKEAFRGCSGLKNLKIGESVSLLHNYAFGGCTSLETIVSMAEPTTMTMGTSVFENVPTETCVLKVPQQYYEDYICTEQWEDFFNIEAIAGDTVNGDVDGDGAVTSADVTIIYNYLLGGEAANIDPCDVDGDGFITSTDITVLYNMILGN